MQRLWVQLTLAFTLVTLLSVTVASLLANRQTSAEFQGFLAQSQAQESGLPAELASYYRAHGSWDGVSAVLAGWRGPGANGAGRGLMRGAPLLVLADAEGVVRYSSDDSVVEQLDASARAGALPIVVDGVTVGLLAVRSAGASGLSAAAERFLARVNLALVQAGLIGALIGALTGLLVARGLAAPLGRLAGAAGQVARGDLAQRVPVGGPAEIAAAGRAFNEMASALEAAEGLRQRMVADIAHELRTPLAVIQGNLQAILDGVYPLERAEVQTILDETLLLGRLVDDLRELALAEAGQLRIEPQRVEVGALLTQSAAAFQAVMAEKGVALSTIIDPDVRAVWADPARSGQVLRNLLANALRHTPSGGVITLRATQGVGDAPSGAPTPQVMIQVEDTGAGIAPEDLPHVFERFWRADRARARAHGGSGLGLAIARQLVQAQSGEMGVRSALGRGSCFWFTLPRAASEALES